MGIQAGKLMYMKLIELTGRDKVKRKNVPIGVYVKVDDEDYDWLLEYKWNLENRNGNRYAITTTPNENGKQKTLKMHRMLLQITDSKVFVDHKNHDGLDNQRDNLRLCNMSQNCMNKAKHKNKYKGVYKHTRKTNGNTVWVATCTVNGKPKVKWRNTEVEAAIAYNEMAIKMHGEFANLNVIEN